jgi:uncharacterized Fe-S cluster-containing protein
MDRIEVLLPGFNCGRCGHRRCSDFSAALVNGETVDRCPFLEQERFSGRKYEIMDVLPHVKDEERIVGVIDGEEAQFSLLPLKGEGSCREDLFPFDRQAELVIGDIIRYRPLGCPITHFARVIGISNGILTVHIIGPRNLIGDGAFEPRDIGICMVAAFEGVLGKGRMPGVGQTVKFLPHHCMMGKVHSGIVVAIEGSKIRIEGIDLKVWSLGH